jgi:MFS family permease
MSPAATQDAAPVAADALATPARRQGRGWVTALTTANVGLWVGWYGPIQILLAEQAQSLAPHDKAEVLALVSGVGAAVSTVATPVFGAISDRTTSRFGRRVPWICLGIVCGALALGFLAGARNVGMMVLGWALVQLTLAASYAALTAIVPDRVPVRQRGVVGGWLGVAQIVGILIGTGLATLAGRIAAGYLACAAFALVAAVPYVLLRRDTPLRRDQRPRFSLRAFFAGFWISPRRYPDFGWAWITRFLVNLSNSLVTMYLLYFLSDAVHYRGKAATGVLILTAVDAATLLATVVVGGMWSDRVGRRQPFVIWSGIIMSVATLLLVVWVSWTSAIIAAAVLGLGFGVYTSVDFALMTDVLPAAADRGKDLGVINIASALPQVAAPAVAAPIVAYLGGYRTLYAVAAVIAILGSVLVRRIRGVR